LPPGTLPPAPPGMPGMPPPVQDVQPYVPEMTEEERKKAELEADPDFMKYYKIYKITKGLAVIKQKMKAEGRYEPALLDVSLYVFLVFI